jgi:mRNA interferase YafQ
MDNPEPKQLKAKEFLNTLQTESEIIYSIKYTNKFKKDVKRCWKRELNLQLLKEAIDILSKTGKLPPEYKAHPLSGKYNNRMECHLQPDWLLVWMQNDNELVLLFTDTDSHANLMNM